MREFDAGCQRPKGQARPAAEPVQAVEMQKGEERIMVKVGKPAPNFAAPAFIRASSAKLSWQITKASGCCSASIQATSLSSEQQKSQQLLGNILSFRN